MLYDKSGSLFVTILKESFSGIENSGFLKLSNTNKGNTMYLTYNLQVYGDH